MTILFDTVQVGPIKNGMQTITVPSSKKNAYITCMTTPEKIDEYITARTQIEKNATKKSLIVTGLATVVGAIGGYFAKIAKTPVIEKTVGGGVLGLCVGALGAFGISLAADSKKFKLNENLVKESMQ